MFLVKVETHSGLVSLDCRTSSTVAFTFLVSDVVIVCTRIGCSLPTATLPTITVRVGRRRVLKIDSAYGCWGTATDDK